MRIPVPRSRLVTLAIVAALLTGVVTIGLANPALFPGAGPGETAPSQGPTPASATDAPVGGASGDLATAPPPTAGTPAGDGAQQPSTAAPAPTPNPNFTPAVQTQAPRDDDEEYEEHEEDDEWDDD